MSLGCQPVPLLDSAGICKEWGLWEENTGIRGAGPSASLSLLSVYSEVTSCFFSVLTPDVHHRPEDGGMEQPGLKTLKPGALSFLGREFLSYFVAVAGSWLTVVQVRVILESILRCHVSHLLEESKMMAENLIFLSVILSYSVEAVQFSARQELSLVFNGKGTKLNITCSPQSSRTGCSLHRLLKVHISDFL